MCTAVILKDNGQHRFERFANPTIITPDQLKKIAEVLKIPLSDDEALHSRSILITRGRRSFRAQGGGGGS
jgi:hypothetical protein